MAENPAESGNLKLTPKTPAALRAIVMKAQSIAGTKDKEPPVRQSPFYELFQQQRRDIDALAQLVSQLAALIPTGGTGKVTGKGGPGEPGPDGAQGPPGEQGPPGPPGGNCCQIMHRLLINGPFTPIGPFLPFTSEPDGIWDPGADGEIVRHVIPRWTIGPTLDRVLPVAEPGAVHYLYADGPNPRIYVGSSLGVAPWSPSSWKVSTGRFMREPTVGIPAGAGGPAMELGVSWLNIRGSTGDYDGVDRVFVQHVNGSRYSVPHVLLQLGLAGVVAAGTYVQNSGVGLQFYGWVAHADGSILGVSIGRSGGAAGASFDIYLWTGAAEVLLGNFAFVGASLAEVFSTNKLFNKLDKLYVKTVGGNINNPLVSLEIAYKEP